MSPFADLPATQTRTARVGDLVEIPLPELPSAGYRWEVVELSMQGLREVEQVKPVAPPILAGQTCVGGAAERTFVFRVLAPGRQVVRLAHTRAWQGHQADDVRHEVVVEAIAR